MRGALAVVIGTTLLAGGCAGERPGNLGVVNGALAACPSSPNCVSSQATEERHRIEPFITGDDPEETFRQLVGIVERRPDATVIDTIYGYLRVELRTTLFTDDAEFLLDRDNRRIQLRSASRLGYSDLGVNRRRIEEIREQLQGRE